MKSKWWWFIGGIVLLVAVTLVARIWFIAPGIHVFGKELHIDLSNSCYIINSVTGEIIDETTISIEGGTSRSDQELFDGELKVLGYQNSADGTITSLKYIEPGDAGRWTITHYDNCTHRETVDDVTKDVEHFCRYYYTYYIDTKAPQNLIVSIESFEYDDTLYAVSASNEQEAIERYQTFINN